MEVLFAGGEDAEEPGFADRGGAQDGGEEEGDGLLGGVAGVGFVDAVAPELQAESADVGGGDGVGDAREFEVEGAEEEVGGLDVGGEEGEEGVGGGIVFSEGCGS